MSDAFPDERKFDPEPLFACCDEDCATELSFPADMLKWLPDNSGLVCENCWEEDWMYKFATVEDEDGEEDTDFDATVSWSDLEDFIVTLIVK